MNSLLQYKFPEKVHLTGADYFHIVLDKHTQIHRTGSNTMRIAFYFEERPNFEEIKSAFRAFPLLHWMNNIRLDPGPLFGTPGWCYEDKGNLIRINESHHDVPDEIPDLLLEKDLPVNGERFIEADLIYYPGNKTALVLSWNHILMDVKGIGILLRHLNRIAVGDCSHTETSLFPPPEKKTGFFRHVINMLVIKKFIETSSKAPVASIGGKDKCGQDAFKNKILRFTAAETKRINELAVESGSPFGANTYYLSCCAHAVNIILKQRGTSGVMWLPVPYDGRLKGSSGPVISNTVNYLFYRIPEKALATIKETVACFSIQMKKQIKDKMPWKYNLLLDMMRHIPLRVYYFLVNKAGDGGFASFVYSNAGDTFNDVKTMFGEAVSGITIFPLPTCPPGLTFSFQKHRDALNINIAYSPHCLNKLEICTIERELTNYLSGIKK